MITPKIRVPFKPSTYRLNSERGTNFGGFEVLLAGLKSYSSWWLNQPNLKIMLVQLDHFPRDRGKNKEYLKPPPGIVFHPTQTIML